MNGAITDLIDLFRIPDLDIEQLQGWKTYRDLEKYESSFELGPEQSWRVLEIKVDHEVGFLTFRCRDINVLAQAMFKKMSAIRGFIIEPKEWKVEGERRYSTPGNTDWMLKAWVS
ncbi:unnamed protein product [Closterium sp. NIES-53]